MALKVKELMQLQSLQGLKLVAGEAGMDRVVCSAGIADYEFASGVEYHNENAFEKESFIISSLLFAQNEEDKILDAVKELYQWGSSAFAFKNIIFEELPEEVIAFANEKGYPIFSFGSELYFENIIYEIMEAVQRDNNEILSETYIKRMIENEMPKDEVEKISKNISLLFKGNAMAVYLKPLETQQELDTVRIFRSFYLNKTLKSKAIICRYNKGLFIILTSAFDEPDKFELILNEVLESLSIDKDGYYISRSGIYHPYENLDCCFRESYHTYIASAATETAYGRFEDIGMFRYLVPLKDNFSLTQFSEKLLSVLMDKEEIFNTVVMLVMNNGDILSTASACSCHQNTIRYRMSKVRELLGAEGKTDFELYTELAIAVRIYLMKKSE